MKAATGEGRRGTGSATTIPRFIRFDFAYSTCTVLYIMAGTMAVAAVVAFLGLQRGRQADPADGAAAAGPGEAA